MKKRKKKSCIHTCTYTVYPSILLTVFIHPNVSLSIHSLLCSSNHPSILLSIYLSINQSISSSHPQKICSSFTFPLSLLAHPHIMFILQDSSVPCSPKATLPLSITYQLLIHGHLSGKSPFVSETLMAPVSPTPFLPCTFLRSLPQQGPFTPFLIWIIISHAPEQSTGLPAPSLPPWKRASVEMEGVVIR